ncbi:MAG: hypothetical protein V3U26_07835, partial [Dehalococcoidia bacterium]
LLGLNAAIIDRKAERAAISGQPIPVIYATDFPEERPASAIGSGPIIRCRAYSLDGRFLAVLAAPTPRGPWAPKKVFSLDLPG